MTVHLSERVPTCFFSLNLTPSRCIIYLLSTWYPAFLMFPSREDRAATDKPKHPCSTNFRQSTWKSSKQNQRSLRKLVKLDNKMLRWHSSTLTTEQLSRAKTALLVILLCLGITRIIGSLNYWRAFAKEISSVVKLKPKPKPKPK